MDATRLSDGKMVSLKWRMYGVTYVATRLSL